MKLTVLTMFSDLGMLFLLLLGFGGNISLSTNAEDTTTTTEHNNSKNTVLDDQFCQKYFTLDDGSNDGANGTDTCSELRARVRSEVRGQYNTPTLELGDKDTQKHMMFLHGWPDTSGLWSNQFQQFCGTDKEYFCIAPSFINYNPDSPLVEGLLTWGDQREAFYSVIEELELTDITFVIFDFGSVIGFQMVYFYPDVFSRVIQMDIPPMSTPGFIIKDPIQPGVDLSAESLDYQRNNVNAFLNTRVGRDAQMMYNVNVTLGGTSPCAGCRIAPNTTDDGVGAATGWLYFNLIRTDLPWMTDGFPSEDVLPYNEWELSLVPSFPSSIPILYLYSSELFQSPEYFEWLNNKNDDQQMNDTTMLPTKYIKINDSDHWLPTRQPEAVNTAMSEWLMTTTVATAQNNSHGSGATRREL